jgi:hypothetical protein
MKKSFFVSTFVFAIVLLLTTVGVAGEGKEKEKKKEKVEVCHITGTYDFGEGDVPIGHVINIAKSALPAHIKHGNPEVWKVVSLPDGKEVCTPDNDFGDAIFVEINEILQGLVGPIETALRDGIPVCYGNSDRLDKVCDPGSYYNDYVYYQYKDWQYEVSMEYLDNTNDVYLMSLEGNPGPGGVRLKVSANYPQGSLRGYIYIAECFTFNQCVKLWANDTACCSCPESQGYDLTLSLDVKCVRGEFKPIAENNVQLSITPEIKITESIGGIPFDVYNITDEVQSSLKSFIVSELNKKTVQIPSVIAGHHVPPEWQVEMSIPEILNLCNVLIPGFKDEVCPKMGYWILTEYGGINAYGNAEYYGHHEGSGAVGLGVTPTGGGYWILNSNGGINCYGDAGYYGHHEGGDDAVDIGVTPTGKGYWILTEYGGINAYGDAGYYGHHEGSIAVGLGVTPTGGGYWILNSNGGINCYGDAEYDGHHEGGDDAVDIGVTPLTELIVHKPGSSD